MLGAEQTAPEELPATGLPLVAQIGIAIALLDLGYLAVSTRWAERRRRVVG